MNAFRACLYKNLNKQDIECGNKVSVVGTGAVGMGCSIALLTKGITNNLALFDVNEELCCAERLDLLHGSMFLHNCHIDHSCKIEATKNSRVVVVTAGARMKPQESLQKVSQKTADIIKQVMPELVKQSPKAIFIIVASPADIMSWVARKVTNLPIERCFSTGCHLDTARFRMFVSHILGVSPNSVQGYVIGEHGGSSVPLWSTVSVGGVRLKTIHPTIGTDDDPMQWSRVHQEVVDASFKVKCIKGYSNWAIGLTVADVISAIFQDSYRIVSLSTNANGMCGIQDDVFLSLPCVINKYGLGAIIRPHLSEWEQCALKKSAEEILKAQCKLKL
ncbi:hypothetical protein ACLKA6_006426 [Drosophila palustris]